MWRIVKKAGNVISGAGQTLKTMGETMDVNAQRKKMLKDLLQNATNKEYKRQTGTNYTWPEEWMDRPTQKWNNLYGQTKKKYNNLK